MISGIVKGTKLAPSGMPDREGRQPEGADRLDEMTVQTSNSAVRVSPVAQGRPEGHLSEKKKICEHPE
jgi:hypothetical protein